MKNILDIIQNGCTQGSLNFDFAYLRFSELFDENQWLFSIPKLRT
jgi:hypothetical protein